MTRIREEERLLQSVYRRRHSTEMALRHVMNSVYTEADAKKITALVSLDILVASDTIDHDVLASRLESQFGVVGVRSDYDHRSPTGEKTRFKTRVRVSVSVRARIMELWNTVTDR